MAAHCNHDFSSVSSESDRIELYNYIVWKKNKRTDKMFIRIFAARTSACVCAGSDSAKPRVSEWVSLERVDTLRMWINHRQACGYLEREERKKPLNKTLYNCFYLFYLVVLISLRRLLLLLLVFCCFNHLLYSSVIRSIVFMFCITSALAFVIFRFCFFPLCLSLLLLFGWFKFRISHWERVRPSGREREWKKWY